MAEALQDRSDQVINILEVQTPSTTSYTIDHKSRSFKL